MFKLISISIQTCTYYYQYYALFIWQNYIYASVQDQIKTHVYIAGTWLFLVHSFQWDLWAQS